MRGTGRRRTRLAAGAVLALLLAPAAARSDAGSAGDGATLEERLQRAQVPPALRLRVHGAVAKGADWILGRQSPEGAFPRSAAITSEFGTDAAAVECACALALASAGEKARLDGARRTLRWMSPPGGGVRREVATRTRSAGLAAMLARELGEADLARTLASLLVAGQDPKSGLWSSAPSPGVAFGTLSPPRDGVRAPDLRGTRDALLGLAAAAAAGVAIPPGVGRRALGALEDEGGAPGGPVAAFLPATGARSGLRLASFEAARALAGSKGAPASVERERDGRAAALRLQLGDEALDGFWAAGKPFLVPAAPPAWCWDVASAALLAGALEFDDERWYPPLAEALLARQGKDGSWTATGGFDGDPLVDTAWAILALTRAAQPLARPAAPPEPGSASASRPAGDAPPSRVRVPLREAEDALAWLEGLVKDPEVRGPELLRFTLFVGGAVGRIEEEADPKEVEAWNLRAEAALVRAAVLEREEPEGVNDLADAGLEAARQLAFVHPRAAAPFRRALEREFARTRKTLLARPFHRAAFESLLRLDREESLAWLCSLEVLSDDADEPARVRTQEALRAAAACREAAGAARREAMERICAALEGLEAASLGFNVNFKPVKTRAGAAEAWFSRRRFAVEALWSLGSDPVTRRPPVSKTGWAMLTVMEYRPWLRDHRDLAAPPWIDR